MSATLKLASVWRVLRDVNLEKIRESAEARFHIPIAADVLEDAAGMARLLDPEGSGPQSCLIPMRSGDALPAPGQPALAGILIARSAELGPAMTRVP